MDRRDFLTASCLLGAAPLGAWAAASGSEGGPREFIELRRYHLRTGPKKNAVAAFFKDVGIPALNRLGVGPVGVFNVLFGPNQPTLHVLLPHKSLESVATLTERLVADDQFRKDGAAFLETPVSDPSYVGMESSLLAAFRQAPQVVAPPQAEGNQDRIFELRTYESHSVLKGQKKIEMFNEGGEVAIFLKTGFHPVFYGETLIGPQMPNLTYMLAFDDMPAREEAWAAFRADPDWHELKAKEQYANTVSNITDVFLRPLPFSQI